MPHLTMNERETISRMLYAGESQGAIARKLSRAPSTISREIRRNASREGYLAHLAHAKAATRRRQRPLVRKLDRPEVGDYVRRRLASCWSPDQIAGRSKRDASRNPKRQVSHQTVYDWINRQGDYRAHWEQFLRFRGRRRKSGDRRGQIPRQVHVDRRPKIVDERRRYGDWEGDTVVGSRGQGGMLTYVDRKSGYLVAGKINNRRSETVVRRSKALFESVPERLRHTVTFDNGKEFSEHERLARQLDVKIYFADPYCSWQRGTNENTNGLLRQFFPKGTDFREVSYHQVNQAIDLINDRPRKRLGYRTPREVLGNRLDPCD